MFKDVLNNAHLSHWAEAGLLIFFVAFVCITIRTLMFSRKQVDRWSRLPLGGNEQGDGHE